MRNVTAVTVTAALAVSIITAASGSAQSAARFTASTEVIASRVTDHAEKAGRREVLLTKEEIQALPVHDITELLAALPGVGLTRRGAFGAQADLNLRGSTFEQTLVLVNGVRIGNSQTGHHDLDLFIPLAAVERVEILYGPGSAAHGSGAFGGAINIVTGVPFPTAHIGAGSHGLATGGVASPLGAGSWVAGERTVQTGFRDDTESSVNQAAAGWGWRSGARSFEVSAAGGERHFGAWKFYSDAYPLERERTSGALVVARAQLPVGSLNLRPYLRADHHRDTFILDRGRPDWYRNLHLTRSYLAGAGLSRDRGAWRWTAGAEASHDDIDSSNLGRHRRLRQAIYGELGWFGDRATADLQLRVDHQQSWGTVTTLAGGGWWDLGHGLSLRLHHGQSFRAPSFTELYYSSPATVGNPLLGPERGRTSEIGLDGGGWSLTVFRRRAHSLIDYLLGDDGVWRATNLGRLTTGGVEAAFQLPAAGLLRWQRLSLEWLHSSVDVDRSRSAYALAHPRLEMAWTGAVDLGGAWSGGWTARLRDPNDGSAWTTLDLRLGRRILGPTTLTVEAANVFDRHITELHGIPLPGRWLSLRLDWRGGR
ncbi:MAG: TonB-dependent receptor [Acidobacteria bacterium]|nr:TonB-dependent receptor [Acidobacteriota bacterium]